MALSKPVDAAVADLVAGLVAFTFKQQPPPMTAASAAAP